jgi:hypothetical protein
VTYDETYNEMYRQISARIDKGDLFMYELLNFIKDIKKHEYNRGVTDMQTRYYAVSDTPSVVTRLRKEGLFGTLTQMLRDEWSGKGAEI